MSLYKRLLVVDDDPTTLLLLELAARPLDLEVTKANDVNRAVDAVRSQAYDLVVLDHDLNGVPGFEVLDYLRKPWGCSGARLFGTCDRRRSGAVSPPRGDDHPRNRSPVMYWALRCGAP
jgi:hypothetical protein